jgi:arginase
LHLQILPTRSDIPATCLGAATLDAMAPSATGSSAIRVITIPFNSSGLSSGVALGPGAILDAGLLDLISGVAAVDLVEVPVVGMEPVRGPSGLLSEEALVACLDRATSEIAGAIAAERFPLVVAGDCPMLLAGLEAIHRSSGRPGLMFVDGHEDAWSPSSSPTGEASDCEMGLALGDTPFPDGLAFRQPAVAAEDTAFLGPRDRKEILDAGWRSVADRVPFIDGPTLAAAPIEPVGAEHAERLRDSTDGWWLHIDLDVLSTDALRAVDYAQPGGLSWDQLDELTDTAIRTGGCLGASVVIYNPDLDPDGSGAGRIAKFGAWLAAAMSG